MRVASTLPYIHTFPECDVAFDGRCCIGGLGVIPCCVFIGFAIDDKRIVIRKTFPWTPAGRRALPKISRIDGLRWEVVIAFDDDGLLRPRHDYPVPCRACHFRSEEHTSELQSLMRISYAVFCLKKKIKTT